MTATFVYPVRVDVSLDPHLSPRLWLVKWTLIVPHHIALFLLRTALAAPPVAAFAILLNPVRRLATPGGSQ